jgi:hypothetical protein
MDQGPAQVVAEHQLGLAVAHQLADEADAEGRVHDDLVLLKLGFGVVTDGVFDVVLVDPVEPGQFFHALAPTDAQRLRALFVPAPRRLE